MDPVSLINVISAVNTNVALEALRNGISQVLAKKQVELTATKDKDSLVTELSKKAELVRGGEKPEESIKSTRQALEHPSFVLEQERTRLTAIAAREHWIGLTFAILAGSIFFATIVLAAVGFTKEPLITLAASVIPGFLSAVFFSREAKIERRIEAVVTDLAKMDKLKESLKVLEIAMSVVPPESRETLANAFSKQL